MKVGRIRKNKRNNHYHENTFSTSLFEQHLKGRQQKETYPSHGSTQINNTGKDLSWVEHQF